jgi:hypothetical protein
MRDRVADNHKLGLFVWDHHKVVGDIVDARNSAVASPENTSRLELVLHTRRT